MKIIRRDSVGTRSLTKEQTYLVSISPSNFYWFPMEMAGTRRSTLIILVV